MSDVNIPGIPRGLGDRWLQYYHDNNDHPHHVTLIYVSTIETNQSAVTLTITWFWSDVFFSVWIYSTNRKNLIIWLLACFIYLFIYLFIHSFLCLFIHSFIYLFVCLFIYSFFTYLHVFIHSFIYLIIFFLNYLIILLFSFLFYFISDLIFCLFLSYPHCYK